jgi:hypothetical protein
MEIGKCNSGEIICNFYIILAKAVMELFIAIVIFDKIYLYE